MKDACTPQWEPKAWGRTRCVYYGPAAEVHELEVVAGGFSSCHYHFQKWNRFVVREGTLRVLLYTPTDAPADRHRPEPPGPLARTVVLTAGMTFDVGPGVWHRFEAATAVTAAEIYWNDSIDPGDIVRADEGGVRAG